jgi:hypothetical protein
MFLYVHGVRDLPEWGHPSNNVWLHVYKQLLNERRSAASMATRLAGLLGQRPDAGIQSVTGALLDAWTWRDLDPVRYDEYLRALTIPASYSPEAFARLKQAKTST